jgi:hypothetical protein
MPLGLPQASDSDSGAVAEAVQLFLDRVRLVQPAFNPDEADMLAVAEVCRRLDGMPLAIELAAAQSALLPPRELAARLDDRFRVLAHGSRAAPPRQRGNVIKADTCVFDVGPVGIGVAQPSGPGPAAEALERNGPGPFQVLLRTRSLTAAATGIEAHGLPRPLVGTRNTGERQLWCARRTGSASS